MRNNLKDWLLRSGEAKRMALIAHASPDGDTVGATLALRLAFLSMGKEVDVVLDGTVPRSMLFLAGADAFIRPEEAAGPYDAAIAVDVADKRLMGEAQKVFDGAAVRLVIDHHPTNALFGDVNFVRGGECSCCVLAYEAIEAMGTEMTAEIGTCLMLGMSTDTGHFQYAYTSARAFEVAAKLVALGVDVSYITRVLYRMQPKNMVALTRIAYQKMRFELDGRVGVIELTAQDFETAGCTPFDTAGLVNLALEVEGVRMAVLATERGEETKLSLRAVEPDTVNDVAARFGGGGHAQAAGCSMKTPVSDAANQILAVMAEKLG